MLIAREIYICLMVVRSAASFTDAVSKDSNKQHYFRNAITEDLGSTMFATRSTFSLATIKENSDKPYHEYYPKRRKKRMVSSLTRGALALIKLLKGTRPLQSIDKRFRTFEKQGDFLTAKKDFFDVDPVGVQERIIGDGVNVISGRVGNREIVIRSAGSSPTRESTLYIIRLDNTGRRLKPSVHYIERVFYRKNIDD